MSFQEIKIYFETHHSLVIAAHVFLWVSAVLGSCHALLNKRDSRSALGWVIVCLGFPGWGVLAYLIFGVNRIRMWARHLRQPKSTDVKNVFHNDEVFSTFINKNKNGDELLKLSNAVSRRPLVSGCQVDILNNGDEAYPAMLDAIEQSKSLVYLTTYIFDNDAIGKKFIDALSRAHARGVDVRVIIDGFGSHYSFPTSYRQLKKRALKVHHFLPFSIFKRGLHLNLRCHRKIIVVDDAIGFTGGMNIGLKRVRDIHFRIQGPVIKHLKDAFLEDWNFVVSEAGITDSNVDSHPKGNALARGITSGPNEDFEKLRWIVTGLFACARKKIRIMTPYFLPDLSLMAAINSAVLRGIEVEVILPEENNLPYIHWATKAILPELLYYGVKFYYQPAPFVHSKFIVVDDFYSLIGSANIDLRSLRLNFEFNMEVYDEKLANQLARHFDSTRDQSRAITTEELAKQNILAKLRNSFFRLFSPYL